MRCSQLLPAGDASGIDEGTLVCTHRGSSEDGIDILLCYPNEPDRDKVS